jgi:hypothetical protein
VTSAARRSAKAVIATTRKDTRMQLSRLPWLLTVLACFVAAALLVLSHYRGYAAVAVAVGLSAAINLF